MSYLSPVPDSSRLTIAARIVAWLIAASIVGLSVVPADLRPETGLPHNVEHFGIFFAAGGAFAIGYGLRHGMLAVVLTLYCGVVEAMQLLVPGRHARLSDFVVDAIAACAGAVIVGWINRMILGRPLGPAEGAGAAGKAAGERADRP